MYSIRPHRDTRQPPFCAFPCQSPYVFPGVVCHNLMVPAGEGKVSTRAKSARRDVKLTILCKARKVRSVNRLSLISRRRVLTASACVQFAVGTKFDTVDRAMVTLQNLALLAVDRVHADPFICQTAGDETILQDGMDGCR